MKNSPFNYFFFFNDRDFSEFYENSIRHDRELNSVPIVTVKATDKDSGDAGTVEYRLEESSLFFEVGSSDGGIRLTSSPENGRCNIKLSLKSHILPSSSPGDLCRPVTRICQICPGLNANEIQIPYDNHHKVSSLVNTYNYVRYEVI